MSRDENKNWTHEDGPTTRMEGVEQIEEATEKAQKIEKVPSTEEEQLMKEDGGEAVEELEMEEELSVKSVHPIEVEPVEAAQNVEKEPVIESVQPVEEAMGTESDCENQTNDVESMEQAEAEERVKSAEVPKQEPEGPPEQKQEGSSKQEPQEAPEKQLGADDLEAVDVDAAEDTSDDNGAQENTAEGNGKKKWTLSNLLLFLVGFVMIGFAAYRIGSLLLNYNNSNQEYDEIAGDFVTVNSNTGGENGTEGSGDDASSSQDWSTKESKIWYEMVSVDLASLQKKYPDVVAWLYQEGDTVISYPVMYSGDNSTYIHTTYKGSYAYAGSIFMEGMNSPDFNDAHTIIYGHNMRNGSMFGTLRYLQTKENYIEDHGYFQIFLTDEIRRYQVFAYEIVEESGWLYKIPPMGSDAYTTLLEKIQNASEISTDVEVTNEDYIVTLSTCYGSNTTKRFVVQGVWVDTYYYDTGMTQSEIDEAAAAAEAATEGVTEDEPQETEELEFLAQ